MALGSRTTSSTVPPGIEIIVIGYLAPLDLATASHSCDKADKSGKHGWVDVLTLDVAGKISERGKRKQSSAWYGSAAVGKCQNLIPEIAYLIPVSCVPSHQQAPSI